MAGGDVEAAGAAEDAGLADVAGEDAEQVVGLVERLLVVGDVALLAADATRPGERRVGMVGGDRHRRLAVAERVGDDQLEAIVGVAADRPLGVAFGNELGVGELADQALVLAEPRRRRTSAGSTTGR